jgi:hypothetical protein
LLRPRPGAALAAGAVLMAGPMSAAAFSSSSEIEPESCMALMDASLSSLEVSSSPSANRENQLLFLCMSFLFKIFKIEKISCYFHKNLLSFFNMCCGGTVV